MVDQGGKFESPGRQRIESSAVHTLGPNTHVPMVDVVPSPPHIVQQTLLSAFPVELLVRIFAHLSKEDLLHQTIAPYAYLFRTLRWFVVAHVCRQWRAVAIDSPTLWQDVDFAMGPTWADVMLSRARTLPVTIHKSFIPVIVDRSFGHVAPLKHWEIFPRREIDLLKAHLFHVERLLLKGPPSGVMSAIRHLDERAPILSKLDLAFSTELSPSTLLPTQFFSGHTPRLHTLFLTNCSFSWLLNLSTASLTKLCIHYESNGWDGGHLVVDYSKLFDFVESIPALQSLHISNRTRHDCQQYWNISRVIELPRLHCFTLECEKNQFLSVIHHIRLPSNALLDLTMRSTASSRVSHVDLDISSVRPFVHAHLCAAAAAPLTVLGFKEGHRYVMARSYWLTEALMWGDVGLWDDEDVPDGAPLLRLAETWLSVATPPPSDTMLRVCAALPLTSVRVLSVDSGLWTSAH